MLIHGGTIRKGFFVLIRRLRVVLDQLEQIVLEHHLARRRGNVLAHLEGAGVGHADAQLAVIADVVQQVVQALDQVLAVALDRLAEHFRVGQREVGRRQGVDVLAGEEIDLLLGRLVEALGTADGVMDVAGSDEVGLLDEVEEEMLLPVLVLEALVALGRAATGRRQASPSSSSWNPATARSSPTSCSSGSGPSCTDWPSDGRKVHERLGDPISSVGASTPSLAFFP